MRFKPKPRDDKLSSMESCQVFPAIPCSNFFVGKSGAYNRRIDSSKMFSDFPWQDCRRRSQRRRRRRSKLKLSRKKILSLGNILAIFSIGY